SPVCGRRGGGFLVFGEPVRSAEPPMRAGTSCVRTESAASLDLRVAIFGPSAATLALYAAQSCRPGRWPFILAENSPPRELASSRPCHSDRSALPRSPVAFQSA